jgi:hypothetical protein
VCEPVVVPPVNAKIAVHTMSQSGAQRPLVASKTVVQ